MHGCKVNECEFSTRATGHDAVPWQQVCAAGHLETSLQHVELVEPNHVCVAQVPLVADGEMLRCCPGRIQCVMGQHGGVQTKCAGCSFLAVWTGFKHACCAALSSEAWTCLWLKFLGAVSTVRPADPCTVAGLTANGGVTTLPGGGVEEWCLFL